MLKRIPLWRHALIGLVIVVMSLLAGFRVIGAGADSAIRPEQFDAKQVTVAPDGADGLRIREVVDIDFGAAVRRGYQRILRNDFGAPTDVTAQSPDANADVSVVDSGNVTRIRIGDPDVTFTGRHRYILEYTLADAGVTTGEFVLDVIGNDETLETDRFEVVLTGFADLRTSCDTGAYGAFGGCEFEVDESGNSVAVIEPLAPGDGITVGARFAGLDAVTMPPLPEPPDPLPTGFQPLGLLMIPLGVAAAALVFLLGRSYGSNTVLAGGAADAAFGDLPVPGRTARSADTPTYRVPDSRLASLATIEFVPPRGLEPWQAAAVLRERIDDDTIAAWFSEMIATDALVISDADGTMQLRRGPEHGAAQRGRPRAPRRDVRIGRRRRTGLLRSRRSRPRGGRSGPNSARSSVRRDGGRGVVPAGVSRHRRGSSASLAVTLLVVGVVLFVVTAAGADFWLAMASPWLAVIAGFLVPLVVAAERVPLDVPGAHGHRFGAGAALGVVPAVPGRERGQARRVGVGAGSVARVQRVGGGARRGRRLDEGDPLIEHRRPAGRARRPAARALGGIVVPLVAHRSVEFRRRWGRWRRRRWWRWRQLGIVVMALPPTPSSGSGLGTEGPGAGPTRKRKM